MAYDEGMATQMREDLGAPAGLSERRMFGGLCFLLDGNMVCGVHKGGAMFRVGKTAEADALALPGARPMDFTGRKMGGMIECGAEAYADDATRQALTQMSLAHAASLPPKG
ncbi:MAG: TfoX/Sxy family protein [Rhodobacteraceae bacterium]|nr:TfoX/Sxy family protein [Paracoccaceae bacterium]